MVIQRADELHDVIARARALGPCPNLNMFVNGDGNVSYTGVARYGDVAEMTGGVEVNVIHVDTRPLYTPSTVRSASGSTRPLMRSAT